MTDQEEKIDELKDIILTWTERQLTMTETEAIETAGLAIIAAQSELEERKAQLNNPKIKHQ